MTSTLSDLASRAADLIEDPDRWCRWEVSVDAGWVPCPPSDPSARRWCAIGAVRVIDPDGLGALVDAALHHFGRPLELINDNDGHAAAVHALRTIAQRYA